MIFQLKEDDKILQKVKQLVLPMNIKTLYADGTSQTKPFDFSQAMAIFKRIVFEIFGFFLLLFSLEDVMLNQDQLKYQTSVLPQSNCQPPCAQNLSPQKRGPNSIFIWYRI